MKHYYFLLGFFLSLSIVLGIAALFILRIESMRRADIAFPLVAFYQWRTGVVPAETPVHILDIDHLPPPTRHSIKQLWGLEITVGIDPNSPRYGPDLRLRFWQFMIMAGKLIWKIETT